MSTVLDNPRGKSGDILSLGAGRLVFADSAFHRCRELLSGVGEWLPVDWPTGCGKYLNVTSASQCINEELSTWHWHEESGKRLMLINPVFDCGAIPDTAIFKDLGQFTHSFVAVNGTNAGSQFKKLVDDGKLTGVSLDLVWQSVKTEEWQSVW